MAVGSTLSIPATLLADWIYNRYVLPWPAALGVAILVAGVAVYYIAEILISLEKKRLKREEEQRRMRENALGDKWSSYPSDSILQ